MNSLSRSVCLVFGTLSIVGCASVPAPATKAPNNPASAAAAEGPIQKLVLFALPDAPVSPAVETAPPGMAMPGMDHSNMDRSMPGAKPSEIAPQAHPGETAGSPVGAKASEDVYTCAMHPQIAEAKPGKCPICGMPLVKKTAGKK